jgi:hypothetical protein
MRYSQVKNCVALEATDAPPGPDERLLGDLLGLVTVAQEPQHDDVEPVGVPADELFERRAVAVLGAPHELGVDVGHSSPREELWAARTHHSLAVSGQRQSP